MLLAPLVAAVTLLALGAAHSLLGERFVLRPLLAAPLPPFLGSRTGMGRTLRASWHLVSLAWWGMAGVLAVAAAGGPVGAGALRAVALAMAATSLVILLASRGRHPAWVGAAVAAAGAWPPMT